MGQIERVLHKGMEHICEQIQVEADATEQFVRDVRLFLESLPKDLGRGSLNGMKAQLEQKCSDYLRD